MYVSPRAGLIAKENGADEGSRRTSVFDSSYCRLGGTHASTGSQSRGEVGSPEDGELKGTKSAHRCVHGRGTRRGGVKRAQVVDGFTIGTVEHQERSHGPCDGTKSTV